MSIELLAIMTGTDAPSLQVQDAIRALFHPGYKSGRFYPHIPAAASGSAAPGAKDILYALPLILTRRVTVDAIGIRATAAGTINMKCALYGQGADPSKPDGGALLGQTASAAIANGANTQLLLAATPINLPAWIVCKHDSAAPPVMALSSANNTGAFTGGDTVSAVAGFSADMVDGYQAADAYANAFPATFPASTQFLLGIPHLCPRIQ